ncbi:hypothetical protein HC251_17450 [Iamia sp. SCSIO 61187]|uniref:FAD binding domain-containing protein n=1 Tax=Iamia sp. SCSIO 61187 TaxID=2722752 RepID=UPI001C62719E|nr:FAD binding domain-containing protein [Iamia sp. SCSIO 61187]QYG94046.1 hypothetical protein HC251_17450 [Iamia sp. SCSIO 61187]
MTVAVPGLVRPRDVDEAVAVLADGAARPVAGATALLVDVARGAGAPSRLVDLTTLDELTALDPAAGSGLGSRRVGAAVSLARLVRSGGALGTAAAQIASHPVRLRATVGGNIVAPGWPHDLRTVLWALGATLEVAGPAARRRVAVSLDPRTLAPQEVLVALHVPSTPATVVAGGGVTAGRPALQVVVSRSTGRAAVGTSGWRRPLPATGTAAAAGTDIGAVLGDELVGLGVPRLVAHDLADRSARPAA